MDFYQQVRKVSESTNVALAADARDLAAKETFIEELVDPDVTGHLLREELDAESNDAESNIPESTKSRSSDQGLDTEIPPPWCWCTICGR